MKTIERIKSMNPIDKHVGSRVRMRRLMLSMSQEKLAHGLDLTFQQVQKYEKGTNRIGASRLQQIATILKVPPAFFFEGLGSQGEVKDTHGVSEFVSSSTGLRIIAALAKIKDPKIGLRIADLLEQLEG